MGKKIHRAESYASNVWWGLVVGLVVGVILVLNGVHF